MRLLVILILVVSLPIRSVGAANMPYCEAGDMAPMDMAAMDHGMNMDHEMPMDHGVPADHADHDMGHHGDGKADPKALDCNQCGLCHLACASALLSSAPVLSDVLQSVYQSTAAVNVASFQPDPFRKPPRDSLR